jgi:putative ATPase
MRPRNLREFVGQLHLLGEGKPLRRAIEADRITSLILFGPPGSGKTALAWVIKNKTSANFKQINAVTSGVGEIRKLIEEAKQQYRLLKRKTICFIDELHRFNKSQQDALLPSVEDGTIILIGTTTQNPYFYITPPLQSRSQIFELYPLSEEDIKTILKRAILDKERGLGNYRIRVDEEAMRHIINYSGGDARRALNSLETAVLTTKPREEDGIIHVTAKVAEESTQKRILLYDRAGDEHYDTISAFIKSMRGSDPDATLYWLAKMLLAGEDPRFIARRIIICASEDVGLADPRALLIAVSSFHAVDVVGMPEAEIILAQAALYVATTKKSNSSYLGIKKAKDDILTHGVMEVPRHLRDAHYGGAKKLGRGIGYKYPHDYPSHFVEQEYIPESRCFYEASTLGYEEEIRRWLEEIKKRIKEERVLQKKS